MKVLVTGSSTVGKSTTMHELHERGFTAFDGDDVPGLCELQVTATGEPAEWPSGYVDWSYYSWNLQEQVLRQLLNQNETVFLGGIYGNQAQFYPLFDKLLVLTLDQEEYSRRLQNRPRRNFGDSDENMADRIKKYPVLLDRFLKTGFTPVDGSGTPSQTADAILKTINYEH